MDPATPTSQPNEPSPVTQPAPNAIETTQPVQPSGVTTTGPVSANTAAAAKKPGRKFKLAALILLGVVLLGGGIAAAYYGVVVPNKPENVLKTALKNTLNQTSVNAVISAEGKEGDSPAYKVELTAHANSESKALAIEGKATVSGVSLSADVRYVDSTGYIKVGDLSNISKLANAYSPEVGAIVDKLSSKVSNQWFEIDSTLLQQGNVQCTLDVQQKLTDADYKILSDLYQKNPFVSITNTSDDTVNGQPATKYQLSIDDDQGAKFFEGIDDISIFKKLKDCGKSSSTVGVDQEVSKKASSLADGDHTPITVWVDKDSKLITKFATETTEQDKKDGVTGKLEATLDYTKVVVTKPQGAKPITDLIAELGSMFKGQPVLGAQIDKFAQ